MSKQRRAGIVAAGAYVPAHRLAHSSFVSPHSTGTRAVANYDEDTTSVGVEAGRRALADYRGPAVGQLLFATSAPAYADKTNATVVHAALGLASSCPADDMVGAVRSGVAAIRAAANAAASGTPSLAVAADIRTGLPGSVDERTGGDGAAAFVFADEGSFLAELVGQGAATAEFLDRWRVPVRTIPTCGRSGSVRLHTRRWPRRHLPMPSRMPAMGSTRWRTLS
jgi:3-hydroxy-3-methylglutaryl CoA synthase